MSMNPIDYCERLPPTADIVIIGGGVIGAATAFFAGRAGLRSVLLEKNRRLCSLTTPAATGAYRLQFDNPEEIALVRRSVDFFYRFNEETGLPPEFDISLRPQ